MARAESARTPASRCRDWCRESRRDSKQSRPLASMTARASRSPRSRVLRMWLACHGEVRVSRSTSAAARPLLMEAERLEPARSSCGGKAAESRRLPLRAGVKRCGRTLGSARCGPPGPSSYNIWSGMGARCRPLGAVASVRRACSSPFRGSGDGRLVCAGRPPPVRADDAALAASSRSCVCTQM